MKREITLFALFYAILYLVSCGESGSPVDQPTVAAIGFDIATQTVDATRSEILELDDLANFAVFAAHSSSAGFVAEQPVPNFMYRQRVDRSVAGWSYTPLKYWPQKGTLSFFAYAPYDTGGTCTFSTNSDSGIPKLEYHTPSVAAEQYDLLAAEPLYDLTGDSRSVNFRFKHLLSAVGFSARLSAALPDGESIAVARLSLQGLLSRGEYGSDWAPESGSATAYTLSAASGELLALPLSLLPQSQQSASSLWMLIPQSVSDEVELVADLRLTSGAKVVTNRVSRPLADLLPSLVAGQRYTLQLVVGMSDFQLLCSVVPWTTYTIQPPSFN